jgi:hypothetical protein
VNAPRGRAGVALASAPLAAWSVAFFAGLDGTGPADDQLFVRRVR